LILWGGQFCCPPALQILQEKNMSDEKKGSTAAVQYLAFKLGNEVYAVDVARVREILDFPPITKVPRTPEFMRGVINLRGSVVPVVDMRLKFGMSMTEKSVNTCIVVVEALVENELTTIGALADSVQEVIELDPGSIEPPPKIGSRIKVEFLKGMGKIGESFLMILDIDRVFTSNELSLVKETAIVGKDLVGSDNYTD
jgi:purine-binding chemotaxis protein CheW